MRSPGEKKPVTVSLCPAKISHGLTWDWNRVSAVTERRLTAWLRHAAACWQQSLTTQHLDIQFVPHSKHAVSMFRDKPLDTVDCKNHTKHTDSAQFWMTKQVARKFCALPCSTAVLPRRTPISLHSTPLPPNVAAASAAQPIVGLFSVYLQRNTSKPQVWHFSCGRKEGYRITAAITFHQKFHLPDILLLLPSLYHGHKRWDQKVSGKCYVLYCCLPYAGGRSFCMIVFYIGGLAFKSRLYFSWFSQSPLESTANTRENCPQQFLYIIRNLLGTARDAASRDDRIPIDGASRPELYSCKDFELRISRIGCVLQACFSGQSLLPRTGQITTHILQTSLHILTICTAGTCLTDDASFWVTFAGLTSGVFLVPWVRTSVHLDVGTDCKFEVLCTVTPTMTLVTFRVKTSV